MKRIALSDGINWMWFVVYSINEDGEAVIHAEDRIHKYEQRKACQQFADACGKRSYDWEEPRTDWGQPRLITHLIIREGAEKSTYALAGGPLPRFGHGHLRMRVEDALA